MKKYEKPVVTVLPGVAEGVYAASGNQKPKIGDLVVVNNWGEGGELKCTVDFSDFDNLSNLTLFLEFNADVSDVSANGGTQSVSGKTAQINWYEAPVSVELKIILHGCNPEKLAIVSASASN